MSLVQHYESYKASVSRDALPAFADYAKSRATADPELWPTVYDFLTHAVSMIKKAAVANDVQTYGDWLTSHQGAMIQLFEHMVNDEVKKYQTPDEAALALLEKGWNWFKFSRITVNFTSHVWIPRYSKQLMSAIEGTLPCYTADEMRVILAAKPAPVIMSAIAEQKKQTRCVITEITPNGQIGCFSVKYANSPFVREWTLQLLPAESEAA